MYGVSHTLLSTKTVEKKEKINANTILIEKIRLSISLIEAVDDLI